MANLPVVDIVLPVYNEENSIAQYLDSIASQTYSNLRILVINDGSTDNTGKVVETYPDKRIVHIELPENKGIAFALNIGLKYSTAPFVARMDADDIMVGDRIEKQLRFFKENPEVDILGSSMYRKVDGNWIAHSGVLPITHEEIKTSMFFFNPMAHPTVMIRGKVAHSFEYDGRYIRCEDYEAWTRLIKHFRFANMDTPLVFYHASMKNAGKEYYLSMRKIYKGLFFDYGLDINSTHWTDTATGISDITPTSEDIFYDLMKKSSEVGISPQYSYRIFHKIGQENHAQGA